MIDQRTPHRRAFVALLSTTVAPAAVLLAAPASAQDAQVAPPPVVPTTQAAPTAPASAPTVQIAPASPVVQAVPQEALNPAADTAIRSTPTRTARSAAPTRTAAPAPRAATPAPAPAAAPAPVAEAPAPTTPAAAPAVAPVDQAREDTTTTTQQQAPADTSSTFNWVAPLLIALIVALGAFAFLRRGRRRDEAVYTDVPETVREERVVPEPVAPVVPVATAEPFVAAAPVMAAAPTLEPEPMITPRHDPVGADADTAIATPETAEIVAAEEADVAAITAADAPVSDRPWLEMAMRPSRAGTTADDAVVEFELTIGNAGSVAADHVRIATFMFAGEPDSNEMERLLLDREAEAVPPVRIAPGEGTTVEATLAIPRDAIEGEITPVIVADARYPLPGGGEGRTSAAFRVGIHEEDGGIRPIRIGRPHMTQTVDAELYGTPEHA